MFISVTLISTKIVCGCPHQVKGCYRLTMKSNELPSFLLTSYSIPLQHCNIITKMKKRKKKKVVSCSVVVVNDNVIRSFIVMQHQHMHNFKGLFAFLPGLSMQFYLSVAFLSGLFVGIFCMNHRDRNRWIGRWRIIHNLINNCINPYIMNNK